MNRSEKHDVSRHYDSDGVLAVERKGRFSLTGGKNRFTSARRQGKLLSTLMRPGFEVLPPGGFGVLTTTGRKTGKRRYTCVRAIVDGERAYIVVIKPFATDRESSWLLNIRSDPNVRLRVRGGRYTCMARELSEPGELAAAERAYVASVNPFDYAECLFHRHGRPTRAKIQELHQAWFETGVPLVLPLEPARRRRAAPAV